MKTDFQQPHDGKETLALGVERGSSVNIMAEKKEMNKEEEEEELEEGQLRKLLRDLEQNLAQAEQICLSSTAHSSAPPSFYLSSAFTSYFSCARVAQLLASSLPSFTPLPTSLSVWGLSWLLELGC